MTTTVIGQKFHEIETLVNTVYMGYQLLEVRPIKRRESVVIDALNIELQIQLSF